MESPLNATEMVSVVIPAFNAAEFIETTIASIRQQSYRPIEVVVVDDGSSDRTAEIVESLREEWMAEGSRLRLIHQPENRGGAAALARGFSEARGAYLCWLSSDDAFVGTAKLAEQVAQLRKHPGVSYAEAFYQGPDPAVLTDDQLVVARWHATRRSINTIMERWHAARLVGLLFRVPINGSTVMIDRQTWTRCGNFDPVLRNIDQDSDMWLRYSALGVRIAPIREPAGFYRIHPGQTSNLRVDCIVGAAATRIRLLRALEESGRLARLLSRTWPVLALAYRHGWHRDRPIVASYLAERGLALSRNPLVRYWLDRINTSIEAERLVDADLSRAAREKADDYRDSGEFSDFEARLSRLPHHHSRRGSRVGG